MAAPANAQVFEEYFRRADLDKDGRISGSEAVAFFQGSNLPKQILAQIWMYADQSRTGFIGKAEFYNALKLVTVAQTGKELTPEIVKSALYGPVSAQIPPPRINPLHTPHPMNSVAPPASQPNSMVRPSAQVGGMAQAVPSVGVNPENVMRPVQSAPAALAPMQGMSHVLGSGSVTGGARLPVSNGPNLSTDWFGNRSIGSSPAGASEAPIRGLNPSTNDNGFKPAVPIAGLGMATKPEVASAASSSVVSRPVDSVLPPTNIDSKDSKSFVASGNGFLSDSGFGGDAFSANSQGKQGNSITPASNSMQNPAGGALVATSTQNSVNLSPNESIISKPPLPPSSSHWQRTVPTTASAVANASAATVDTPSSQSQQPWPKITKSDVRKYTSVFVKVDKDRDGKITGLEARNLFLSWGLPREVLKQVWDLSDQDNDSMLSLREFCIALYLMERFREGRPLPAVLPNSIRYDETLLLATGQQSAPAYAVNELSSTGYATTQQASAAYGSPVWQANSGLQQQGLPGPRPVVPNPGVRQTVRAPIPPQTNGAEEPVHPKSKVPVLEKHLVGQLDKDEQSALNSKFQEAADADKRVQELEKEILESKQKIEFYGNKMQELILYKSRCDNRLNEVIEGAAVDKREAEMLAKKYEEKYKQIGGDIASRLTLEEATFRDIQERKLRLYNAIIKMEQGETGDGILQGRADSIQSDLEELVKTLNDRCKQYGLRAKPTSLIELPFGWQPEIQEGAADWTEDWDEFDDEGYTIVKELTVEVENIVAPPKSKSITVQSNKTYLDEVSPSPSSPAADVKMEKPSSNGDRVLETESANALSNEESAKSPSDSPRKSADQSHDVDHDTPKSGVHDVSPHANGSHRSEHGGVESTSSFDKFADEPSWGATFDASDDADSVWGFSSINTKGTDYEQKLRTSFFDTGDFGLHPIRTGSPSAASVIGKEKGPFFDSVPSTPLFNSGFSPRFNDGPDDHSFNSNFSRFDSFNMHDGGLFPQRDFTRFDSMSSTTDNSRVDSFARFDSFKSTADQAPTFTRFDSMHSTTDHPRGFPSFDDADPFGSGPFKSSGSYSPKAGTDNWSAF